MCSIPVSLYNRGVIGYSGVILQCTTHISAPSMFSGAIKQVDAVKRTPAIAATK